MRGFWVATRDLDCYLTKITSMVVWCLPIRQTLVWSHWGQSLKHERDRMTLAEDNFTGSCIKVPDSRNSVVHSQFTQRRSGKGGTPPPTKRRPTKWTSRRRRRRRRPRPQFSVTKESPDWQDPPPALTAPLHVHMAFPLPSLFHRNSICSSASFDK